MPKVLIRVSPTRLPPDQILAYPLPFLAQAVGVSKRLLHKQIKLGTLRAFKIGTRTVVLAEDAQRLLHAKQIGVATEQRSEGASTERPADDVVVTQRDVGLAAEATTGGEHSAEAVEPCAEVRHGIAE